MRGDSHGWSLASFGGITRIRFKGSSDFADLSARRLPRTYLLLRIRPVSVMSTRATACRAGRPVTRLGPSRAGIAWSERGSASDQSFRMQTSMVSHASQSLKRSPLTKRKPHVKDLAQRSQRPRRYPNQRNLSFVLKLASAPRLARCCPRSFTFYVANPIRSILRELRVRRKTIAQRAWLLPPVSRSCGKWPAICRSSFSRQSRR